MMLNAKSVLEAAGSSFDKVVKANVGCPSEIVYILPSMRIYSLTN
jgi:enamine deaminase RidA (YjgF/YER057c/UK114 family)